MVGASLTTHDLATLVRPQPVGVFSAPAGLLLIAGDAPDVDQARRTLLAGRRPNRWPATLRGHELAYAGDHAGAVSQFTGDDPVSTFNRWVLDPQLGDPVTLRSQLPPAYAPLVDVVAYVLHGAGIPVDFQQSTAPEVSALVLTARADAAQSAEDREEAPWIVAAAAARARPVSPVLAGVLRAQVGILLQEKGDVEVAAAALQGAAEALVGTELAELRAEVAARLEALSDTLSAEPLGAPHPPLPRRR